MQTYIVHVVSYAGSYSIQAVSVMFVSASFATGNGVRGGLVGVKPFGGIVVSGCVASNGLLLVVPLSQLQSQQYPDVHFPIRSVWYWRRRKKQETTNRKMC
jgi:hypothetical protein